MHTTLAIVLWSVIAIVPTVLWLMERQNRKLLDRRFREIVDLVAWRAM